MAASRIDKTRDYTVMSNHHLRNTGLSLKAKGLLSLMLSLPEEWDYATKGLAHICKDGVDSICAGVRELEELGYVIRERVRNENGQLGAIEYTILEQPIEPSPKREKPKQENPVQVNPILDNPIPSNPPAPTGGGERTRSRIGTDGMGARETYREIVLENIDYDILIQDTHIDRDRLDEIAELIVDTVCSARRTIRIAGDDYPAEVVKSRFLKLDSSHVQYVMDCMRDNTTYVRNIKKYLLAALYNAPSTINSYYSSLVQHDMYEDGRRGRE